MKLLLDTHIWIWSQLSPQRIGPKLRRWLLAEKSELWLSGQRWPRAPPCMI
jgi:PIN domain nuclease of toxin-antitoxin system